MAPFEEMEVDPPPPPPASNPPSSPDQGSDSGGEKLQKVNRLQALIPYADHAAKSRQIILSNLKAHMFGAVLAQGEELRAWIVACRQYLSAFDLAIGKRDHVTLIELCLKTMHELRDDYGVIRELCKLLFQLLRKPHLLSRNDLRIEWRPLYDLMQRTTFSRHFRAGILLIEPEFEIELHELISVAKIYFSAESTAEMLAEWRQYMCRYSPDHKTYIALHKLFLPTMLSPEEHHAGFRLWLGDFLDIWNEVRPIEIEQFGACLSLFAEVAKNAIGHIDWEPHLPLFFQRAQLMLTQHGLKMPNELREIVQLIVYTIYPGSSSIEMTRKLLDFCSATQSTSTLKQTILAFLDQFVRRIRLERDHDRARAWYSRTPESHLLTDEIIAEFSAFLYKKCDQFTFLDYNYELMHKIAVFCAAPMAEDVIVRKMRQAREHYIEPDRMKSALQMFSISLFHIMTDEAVRERYRAPVLSLLGELLESINTTDHHLCYLHLLAIRSIVMLGIPLQDCTHFIEQHDKKSNSKSLTDAQKRLLEQSGALEDFGFRFLRCCLDIIESGNDDLLEFSRKEYSIRSLIGDVFRHVCLHVSRDQYRVMVCELFGFVDARIIENVTCCRILDMMITTMVEYDITGYAFKKFYSGLTGKVIEAIDDKHRISDICKSEFRYSLHLLSACFSDHDNSILTHADSLIRLFERIFALDFEENSSEIDLAVANLQTLLMSLTDIFAADDMIDPRASKAYEDDPEQFIRDRFLNWPHLMKLDDFPVRWHVPTEPQVDFARSLYRSLIKPQLRLLDQWSRSEIDLSRSDIEKSLHIALGFIGQHHCLAAFSGDDDDDRSSYRKYYSTITDPFARDLFDGENFRDYIVTLMQRVLQRLKQSPSDNVSPLKLIIKILDYIVFTSDAPTACSDISLLDEYSPDESSHFGIPFTRSHKSTLDSTYQPMLKGKPTIPFNLEKKICEYDRKMQAFIKTWCNTKLSAPLKCSIDQLLDLATSSVTEIRTKSQDILQDITETFSRSAEMIVPRVAQCLREHARDYDAFKGALYLALGSETHSLLTSDDWRHCARLWPALVEANFVEKPKIVDFLEDELLPMFTEFYFTIPIDRRSMAPILDEPVFRKAVASGFRQPTPDLVKRIVSECEKESDNNRELYQQLIRELITILDSHKMHWRFLHLGFHLLNFLIRPDYPVPREMINLFLDNIAHDSVLIRTIASAGFRKILFLLKPAKRTETIDGVACHDFGSISLDDDDCYADRHAYESTRFYDKIRIGFLPDRAVRYTVRVPTRSNQSAQTNEKYGFIAEKFQSETFLDVIFKLYSLEKEKNDDRHQNLSGSILAQLSGHTHRQHKIHSLIRNMFAQIDENFCQIWLYLFQMFGLFNLEQLCPRLERLLRSDDNKSQQQSQQAQQAQQQQQRPHEQKLAAEIVVAIIKSFPWLDFDQANRARQFLTATLSAHLPKCSPESAKPWAYSFGTLLVNRDLRRNMWLVRLLLAQPLFTDSMPVAAQATCLQLLEVLLLDNWRYSALGVQILATLEQQLQHNTQIMRRAVASFLEKSIFFRLSGVGFDYGYRPAICDFVDRIVSRLDRSLAPLFVSIRVDDQDTAEAAEAEAEAMQDLATLSSTLFDNRTEDGQKLNDYIETISIWAYGALFNRIVDPIEMGKLFPYFAVFQSADESAQENTRKLLAAISMQSLSVCPDPMIDSLIQSVEKIFTNWNWHTRKVAVQTDKWIYNNYFILKNAKTVVDDGKSDRNDRRLTTLIDLIVRSLSDEKLEVREAARHSLSTLIACKVIDKRRRIELIEEFKSRYDRHTFRTPAQIALKHSAILGLGAFIGAHPRRVPKYLPEIVLLLCRRLSDPNPIQKTVNDTLRSFMKSHKENWIEYERRFTEAQLQELHDVPIFSSYIC